MSTSDVCNNECSAITIENIVCCSKLCIEGFTKTNINLEELAKNISNVQYNVKGKKFRAAAILRLKRSNGVRATALVFSSGCMIIIGKLKDLSQARSVSRQFGRKIQLALSQREKQVILKDFRAVNSTLAGGLFGVAKKYIYNLLNLRDLTEQLKQREEKWIKKLTYCTTQFPGLRIRTNYNFSITIFSSAKFFITGVKDLPLIQHVGVNLFTTTAQLKNVKFCLDQIIDCIKSSGCLTGLKLHTENNKKHNGAELLQQQRQQQLSASSCDENDDNE
jgi:TATA-box binding protein (TBP) (component of TFIID and TFIIIB)